MPSIEKMFTLLETDKCSLQLQREITWILINLNCSQTEGIDYFNDNFNLFKVLALTIQRCNDKQKICNAKMKNQS